MRVLPTIYRGLRFRSRLEARWAMFFDGLGIRWDYETEGFQLDSGEGYLPDFWLPRFHYPNGIYVEVKPEGGDYTKAREFVLSGGGAILEAEGPPEDRPYRLLEPNHQKDVADYHRSTVVFAGKYLPGGSHQDEYRLCFDPSEWDLDLSRVVEVSAGRARSARFENVG